ncbi:hypothetical protein [Pyxidicoccus trucidator]|uniref:hypothetical protein n=1 Tax=Pyxidicoccus trucidator TaxID=2709662 RepID=UPI0013DA86B4|nr:hypothetical protein [Pyxidicoccus trucidator]
MRSKTWLPSLIVACMALIVSLYQSRRHEASRAELENLREEVRRLDELVRNQPKVPPREDGRAVAEAVAYLEQQAALREARMQALAGAGASSDAGARQQDTQAPPPQPTYAQAQANVLSAYELELPDDAWSGNAERRLGELVRGRLPGGSRLNVLECRATMCQVEVSHADQKAHGPFLMDGFMGWPGSLFVASERQEHGELVVTIIASREGTDPPTGMR